MERRHDEFAELVNKATELLLDEIPPVEMPNAMFELLISIQPAFGNWQSWVLFVTEQRDDFIIRHTVWDHLFDRRRFFDPLEGLKFGWHTVPSITKQTKHLPATQLHDLLASGRM